MWSQAQAALAPRGALWGPSVGVNLKQQADIPVESVTVHAWVMMPKRQVTGSMQGESDGSSFQLHVLGALKDGVRVGGTVTK